MLHNCNVSRSRPHLSFQTTSVNVLVLNFHNTMNKLVLQIFFGKRLYWFSKWCACILYGFLQIKHYQISRSIKNLMKSLRVNALKQYMICRWIRENNFEYIWTLTRSLKKAFCLVRISLHLNELKITKIVTWPHTRIRTSFVQHDYNGIVLNIAQYAAHMFNCSTRNMPYQVHWETASKMRQLFHEQNHLHMQASTHSLVHSHIWKRRRAYTHALTISHQ